MIDFIIGWIVGFFSAIVTGAIISRNKKEVKRKDRLETLKRR